MIQKRADSFGCLAIGFIFAFFGTWVFLGLASLGTPPPGTTRTPVWLSAASGMTIFFGSALVLATLMAASAHRRAVFAVGLSVGLTLYVIVGLFWWFRM